MRVAFVHDWLVTYRGGERVLEALLELYPEAPIYTLFYEPEAMPESIRRRDIRVGAGLNSLRAFRKLLLPLLPAAIEALPLEDYDLVISSSSCVAKGVMIAPNAKHICYIHSPMRYIWDQRRFYLTPQRQFSWREALIHCFFMKLRMWDTGTNHRVDRFVANSSFVRARVRRYYGRNASIVYPPVSVAKFTPQTQVNGGYFLAAGAFVKYKRFDLAIAACEHLGLRLIIAGSGPEFKQLKQLAGKMTEFRLQPKAEEWVALFQGAEALLFPGVEDFGITAIEAMAAGTPVIAFQAGGALDFIQENKTGLFFAEATTSSLVSAMKKYRKSQFSQEYLIQMAHAFSHEHFLRNMRREIASVLEEQI